MTCPMVNAPTSPIFGDSNIFFGAFLKWIESRDAVRYAVLRDAQRNISIMGRVCYVFGNTVLPFFAHALDRIPFHIYPLAVLN